jgi:hypothetical protein
VFEGNAREFGTPNLLLFLPQQRRPSRASDDSGDESGGDFDRKQSSARAVRKGAKADKTDGARRSERAGRARVSYAEANPDDEDYDDGEETEDDEEDGSGGEVWAD